MVVVNRLAGHVGVVAVRQVDPFHQRQLREQLERPEHGGPADRNLLAARVGDEVRGRKTNRYVICALHDDRDDPRFEIVVLDTPPAQNALDFLDAPSRITHFIEGKSLRMLLSPDAAAGHVGWKLLHAGSSTVFSILERVTGAQLLRDLSEFLAAFDGMYSGFSERAERVGALLHSPRAAFIVVSSADDEPVREAVMLVERLTDDRYPLGPAVMNRIRPRSQIDPPSREALVEAYAAAGAVHPEDLADRTLAQLAADDSRARRDHDACSRLARLLGDRAPLQVPDFTDEPVEIAGLEHVADALAP